MGKSMTGCWMRAAVVLVTASLGGCSGGSTRNGPVGGGAGTGGSSSSSGDGRSGAGGTGSPTGLGGSPVAGPGAPCGTVALTAPLTLPPAAAGQLYIRCGTLGPQAASAVTLSPTGNRLAALTGGGTVQLIATDNWTDVAQLASPLGRMDAVAFSPDGATLATLSSEMGQVALWSALDGSPLRTFAGPPASGVDGPGGALGFSSDGRRLATSLGTVIDLASGTSTSWLTGAPSTTLLVPNPENLSFGGAGGAVVSIAFTAGDTRLLVKTLYQIGNSPTSTRLELRDPVTGDQAKLFDMYTRALLGFALSRDGRSVAVADSAEAAVGGFTPGLTIFDGTTGAPIALDATFTGTVLGFSPDGARLYTRNGSAIQIRATADLSAAGQFDWPPDAVFLGISPTGDVVGVGSSGGATSWWDPTTGAIVRTETYPLTTATWSADGRFGAGTGDPARLFHFWREADAAQLCAPPADTTTAPPLASLGTPGPGPMQSVTSADGSVTVTATFVVHTHATDYDALAVTDTATGSLLRQFGATIGAEPIAISIPSGDQLFTPEGPDVAVWCR